MPLKILKKQSSSSIAKGSHLVDIIFRKYMNSTTYTSNSIGKLFLFILAKTPQLEIPPRLAHLNIILYVLISFRH